DQHVAGCTGRPAFAHRANRAESRVKLRLCIRLELGRLRQDDCLGRARAQQEDLARHYCSGFAPEILTMRAHLAMSSATKRWNAAVSINIGTAPCRAHSARISSRATIFCTSALRRLTIAAEVPRGAMRPNQITASYPGTPASPIVGIAGSTA